MNFSIGGVQEYYKAARKRILILRQFHHWNDSQDLEPYTLIHGIDCLRYRIFISPSICKHCITAIYNGHSLLLLENLKDDWDKHSFRKTLWKGGWTYSFGFIIDEIFAVKVIWKFIFVRIKFFDAVEHSRSTINCVVMHVYSMQNTSSSNIKCIGL